MHTRPDTCLFDDCVDRTRLAQCMDRSHICDGCRSKLGELKVSDQVIDDVESVLGWCRKTTPTLALAYSLKHPLTGFSLGIGLGWFTSVFLTGEYYAAVLLVTLALPVFLFLWKWLFH